MLPSSLPPYVQQFHSVIQQLRLAKKPTPETRALAQSVIRPENNLTCLRAAVEARNVEAVELLLEHGADPNDKSLYGLTSLHLIAYHGRKDIGGDGFKPGSRGYVITMLLLEHRVDIEAYCNDNQRHLIT